jgi:hypothetical protein
MASLRRRRGAVAVRAAAEDVRTGWEPAEALADVSRRGSGVGKRWDRRVGDDATAAGIKERRLREVPNTERLGRGCRVARRSRRDEAGMSVGRRVLVAREMADESRDA